MLNRVAVAIVAVGMGFALAGKASAFQDRVETRGPHDKPETHTSGSQTATRNKDKKDHNQNDNRGKDPKDKDAAKHR